MAQRNNPQYTTEPYDGRYNAWLAELRNKPKVYATYEELLAAQAVEEQSYLVSHVDETFAPPEPLRFVDGEIIEFRPSYYPSLLPALELEAPPSDGEHSTPSLTPSSSASRTESSGSAVTTPGHEGGKATADAPVNTGNAATTEPAKRCILPGHDHDDAAAAHADEDKGRALAPTAEDTTARRQAARMIGAFALQHQEKQGPTAPVWDAEENAVFSPVDTKAAQDARSAQATRGPLKRRRNTEHDDEDDEDPVLKKRQTSAARTHASTATDGRSGAVQSSSFLPREQPSTAETSAQPTRSAPAARRRDASAAPSKPMEECNASHIIKEYARQRGAHLDQAANAILALGPIVNATMLPPRQHLTDAVREQLKSIAKTHAVPRRARVSDPGYYACEKCDTEYGIKNEAIMTNRKDAHNAGYHKDRMCSVCGVLVNGREFKHGRAHRDECALWRPLVAKDLHQDWLRARGFYEDEKAMREFWPVEQIRMAKQQARAAGNPAVMRSYLEQALAIPDVQELREQIQAAAQASRDEHSRTGSSTDANDQAESPEYQALVARPQFWPSQPEAGPSRILVATRAPSSVALPVAQSQYMQPGAPTAYDGGRDYRDVSGYRVLPNAFGLVYRPTGTMRMHGGPGSNGAIELAARNQVGEADQGRRGTASANTVADSARSIDVDAATSAEESSHPKEHSVFDSVDLTEGYSASWDDDDDVEDLSIPSRNSLLSPIDQRLV